MIIEKKNDSTQIPQDADTSKSFERPKDEWKGSINTHSWQATASKSTQNDAGSSRHQGLPPPSYLSSGGRPEAPLPPLPSPTSQRSASSTFHRQHPTSGYAPMQAAHSAPTLPRYNSNGSTKCTNHLKLVTKSDAISGTFLVNPGLCHPLSCLRDAKNNKRRKRKVQKIGLHPAEDIPATAHLETGGGALSVHIGVVGIPEEGRSTKAKVELETKAGKIDANLFEISPARQIDLHVTSQTGDITVLIPPNFFGPVHLNSKHGKLTFLPSLANRVQVVHADDHEALVMVGKNVTMTDSGSFGWQGDSANLSSKKGNIIVGICGEDSIPEKVGFWRKTFEKLLGEKATLST